MTDLSTRLWLFRWWLRSRRERMAFWLAWKMPRWLVYLCSVRLMAHATQGPYSNQVVPELYAIDALKRWKA